MQHLRIPVYWGPENEEQREILCTVAGTDAEAEELVTELMAEAPAGAGVWIERAADRWELRIHDAPEA